MITLKNISHSYKKEEPLFEQLNLTVLNGDSIGIAGDNGSGKSTLIKIMLSIIQPVSGSVFYDEKDINKYRKDLMKHIGVVWGQRTSLWWDLTVKEGIYETAAIFDVNKTALEKNFNYYAAKLSIKNFLDKRLRKVSAGQRILADIVAVLVREPNIIFLDEAFIGLDYETNLTVIELLKDYKKTHPDCIFIVTSHDFDNIASLCNKLLVIKKDSVKEYDMNDLLDQKYTELIIETKKQIEFKNIENLNVSFINPFKMSILINRSLNDILKHIDWDKILKIEIIDKTVDMLIKHIM